MSNVIWTPLPQPDDAFALELHLADRYERARRYHDQLMRTPNPILRDIQFIPVPVRGTYELSFTTELPMLNETRPLEA